MPEFLVPVRNEFTGEIKVVPVICTCAPDAQIEALRQLFRSEGWAKATALRPDSSATAS